MNSIELKNVSQSYKKSRVLHSVDLTLGRGEIFGLLGPSGCGKTTTVKAIAGLLCPEEGTVQVLGKKMPDLSIMGRIGYMAQAAALYPTLTAMENLRFFGKLYKLSKDDLTARIRHVTGIVGLGDELDKKVSAYSGGMMQRLSLAIALLPDPEVLILDEPTVGIDPVLRAEIWRELRMIAEGGATILITTHVMDEAAKCNRLAMMREGRIIATGTPDELVKNSGKASIEEAFIYYGGGSHEN
ncbi:ABC transporter ATP-binding protein [Aminicella lysinilytica]|uniref:ABC-2 type transport system ATP-binding protein n=1 Tax=Aminicella lysinilytica TaxID=433323 RepID=A0A4R6Q0L5_9FIRM|nr:ABC transporter ATP-binding protein [Aminicella lysinilytica]TDP54365.1 ABC-2 type transport system ATP-binding protein [Aminicella lysinilytica]